MSYKDNAFPIQKGKVNLGAGGVVQVTAWCVEDGSLTITWNDDTTSVVDMVAGNAVDVRDISVKSVVVTTGVFHSA